MTKAKSSRIAVPAFYSTVGFALSVGLQATCGFVDRKLSLELPLTRKPTGVPTTFPTNIPMSTSAAPTIAEGEGGPISTALPTSAPTPQQQAEEQAGGGGRGRSLQAESTTSTSEITENGNEGPQPTSAPTAFVDSILAQSHHSVGLWEWQVDTGGICYPYSICMATKVCLEPKFDSAFNCARSFAILSSLLGGFVTLVLLIALAFPFDVAYLTPVYLLLMIFQGLSLMVFSSDMCHTIGDVNFWLGAEDGAQVAARTKDIMDFVTSNTLIDCGHGSGSKMAISAIVMWFLAAITCFRNMKKTRDV